MRDAPAPRASRRHAPRRQPDFTDQAIDIDFNRLGLNKELPGLLRFDLSLKILRAGGDIRGDILGLRRGGAIRQRLVELMVG